MTSIQIVIGIAVKMKNTNLEVEQIKIKNVFLYEDLYIYIEVPRGFQRQRKEDYACKLKKNLYGLKQALK